MKCLYKDFIIFSSILYLNFPSTSFSCIKKSVYSLTNKKILLRSRSTIKSPYFYLSNPLISSLKKSKLSYSILQIPPSLYHLYYRRYPLKLPPFDISILKQQLHFINNNLKSILHNFLHTNIESFSSDFRLLLSNYNSNLHTILNYIRENGLSHTTNYNITSCIMITPQTEEKNNKKASFYPRYILLFFKQLGT